MPDPPKRPGAGSIDRRRALQLIGASATVGLAGCGSSSDGDGGGSDGGGSGGGGDGGSDDGGGGGGGSGERVPTLDLTYWSNVAFTPIAENILPVVTENMSTLGIDVELRPTEFTTEIVEQIEDQRTRHLQLWYYTSDPGRLDPNPMLERFFAERAGNTGTLNTANYVNCEYTVAGHRQATTTEEEQRREFVLEAQRILSEDAVINPVSPVLNVAAVRSDEVEIGGVGDAGVLHHNPHFYIQSTPKNGNSYTVDTAPTTLESSQYQVLDSTPALSFWNHLVSSTLVEYDENLELQNMLAEDITLENDGKRVVVTLRDDAKFQNGDPITAEDVQFTFQYLWERPEQFPQLEVPPYESIEVVDDLTTEFTFSQPYAPLLNRNWATWGILHRDSWVDMGALEQSSVEPGTDLIGSGPFELTDFTSGDAMTLSPVDTHPVHKPGHSIDVQVFRDLPPKVQAFKTNDIQVMINIPFSVYEEVNSNMSDFATTEVAEGTLCWGIFHNFPMAPSKFRPYRRAVGQSLDRALINETAFYGESYEPLQSTVYMRNHPYQPPEGEVYTFNDPSGDMEAARSILEEAGWSWDSNDNLRYPQGANLEPLWPKGETPDPSDYPCLNSEGEFQYPN